VYAIGRQGSRARRLQTALLISKHVLEMQEQVKIINRMHCEMDIVCGQDTGVESYNCYSQIRRNKKKQGIQINQQAS
jgi:hypothetical protein